MSMSPKSGTVGKIVIITASGTRGLQRLICLKYYNELKRDVRLFTLLRSVANFQYFGSLEIFVQGVYWSYISYKVL